jgi:hypothetical protein
MMFGLLALLPAGTAPFAQAQPAAVDPRIGSWTLVSAEGSLDPPNRLTITPQPGGMHVVMSGETHFDFTASLDGKKSAAPGNLGFDQIELHKINRKQADVVQEKNGVVISTVHEKLSPDGNELTSTTAITGKPAKVTVWTRTGGKKAKLDPFVGEWTEDLGKSLMQQAQKVQVEGDGQGGIRFSAEYSYSGRLDGKPYELKNSRNDTVSLNLADAHTVNAVYRRDNQVTQTDKWVVSPDGHEMTVSTAGTLETGQRLTEKLVFKK